ncbi:excisionase family DNA binding protein [Luteococcus japonicus]|uniref:Excisionase family DNA binding protein n=1 Tax=Luteococcus japonicus TaxID=33984 RepID=A0A3N1ZQV9_9ACTN|nr:helix-turn-helix domain-containing protein [Luteococcus japonicus]ROR53274.1 excisionase family DNA binding protein [Luteococcus japonicus]
MRSAPKPASVTIAELAEQWGCSDKTVRRLISSGQLPAYRVGKRLIRILQEDADSFARRIPSAKVVA